MDEGKLMLLLQLATYLGQGFEILKKTYNSSDKEKFDEVKKGLLEAQKKIDYILK